MTFDINKLRAAIDEWSMNMGEENITIHIPDNSKKKRNHLGLSMIGDECQRAVWYDFRHIVKKVFPPRVMRLFQRGHREEFFFERMLRGVGLKIYSVDPKTGKQFRVEDFEGHLAGSMDGVGRDKDLLFVDVDMPFKPEYKTYNKARFKKLVENGVKESDPKYYTQMTGYLGYERRLGGALFCAVCKDNDDLHFEWIRLDEVRFDMIHQYADDVINTNIPPRRPPRRRKSDWRCKMCDFHANCFDNKPSLKSCRACAHSSPSVNKSWVCNLDDHEFGKPCDDWEDVNR